MRSIRSGLCSLRRGVGDDSGHRGGCRSGRRRVRCGGVQKFAGAAADLLNANIIARDLGLADKQDLTNSDGTLSRAPVYKMVDKDDGDSAAG